MAGSSKTKVSEAARAAMEENDEERRLAEKAARKAEKKRLKALAEQAEASPEPSDDTEMATEEEQKAAQAKAERKAARRAEKARLAAEAEAAEKKNSKRKSPSAEDSSESKQADDDDESQSKEEKRKRKQQKTSKQTDSEADASEEKSLPSASPPRYPSASPERTASFHKEHKIGVKGSGASDVHPIVAFNELVEYSVPSFIMPVLSSFEKPTPIQSQCWPAVLTGRDVIGIAKTGSGKTLGFILPAMVHLNKLKQQQPKLKGPSVLVLAPTRELALQITEVAEAAGKVCKFKSVCIYGGVDKSSQAQALRHGVDLIVATPGRLLGLEREGAVSLSNVSYLVLDEADRMLDLGFEPDIRAIIGMCTKGPGEKSGSEGASGVKRQTLLFSATWPEEIQKLGREFVHNPIHITIGISLDSDGTEIKAQHPISNHDVTQIVEVIEDRARDPRLDQLLRDYHSTRKNRIIIFVLYKKEAPRIESFLQRKGWKAVSIHGDKSQAERTKAFEEFKSGKSPLLVATDVAARGLNIPDVSHVINYSFPLTVEDYVHRIGRTGRAGKKGTAYTFFTRNDKGLAGSLVNVLNEAKQNVPKELLAFGTAVKKKTHDLYGAHFKDVSDGGPPKQATRITFSNDDDE